MHESGQNTPRVTLMQVLENSASVLNRIGSIEQDKVSNWIEDVQSGGGKVIKSIEEEGSEALTKIQGYIMKPIKRLALYISIPIISLIMMYIIWKSIQCHKKRKQKNARQTPFGITHHVRHDTVNLNMEARPRARRPNDEDMEADSPAYNYISRLMPGDPEEVERR